MTQTVRYQRPEAGTVAGHHFLTFRQGSCAYSDDSSLCLIAGIKPWDRYTAPGALLLCRRASPATRPLEHLVTEGAHADSDGIRVALEVSETAILAACRLASGRSACRLRSSRLFPGILRQVVALVAFRAWHLN